MKFYTSAYAPNPRRVMLFIAACNSSSQELGMTVIPVDLAQSQNRQPEFLALHPLGQVPVLQIDDQHVLHESVAICRYLGSLPALQQAANGLWGMAGTDAASDDGWQAARVEQYSRQAEWELLMPMMLAFQHGHRFWQGKKTQIAELVPVVTAQAQRGLAYFETALADEQPYLTGLELSMADLTLYTALHFGKLAGIRPDAEQVNLAAFYQRMHSRFSEVG